MDTATADRRLRKFCRVMAVLTLIGVALMPVGLVFFAAQIAPAPVGSAAQKITLICGAAIGAGLRAFALWSLRRTFLEGAQGRWFSARAVRAFRTFALTVLAAALFAMVESVVLGLVLFDRPAPPAAMLGLLAEAFDPGMLFLALLLVFVAHVFAVGRRIDEDNRAIL